MIKQFHCFEAIVNITHDGNKDDLIFNFECEENNLPLHFFECWKTDPIFSKLKARSATREGLLTKLNTFFKSHPDYDKLQIYNIVITERSYIEYLKPGQTSKYAEDVKIGDMEELNPFFDVNEILCEAEPPEVKIEDILPRSEIKVSKTRKIKSQLGDTGYEFAPNPVRQNIGAKSKGLGISHDCHNGRRKYGTVNFSSMDINQKRLYWRWSAANKKAKKQNSAYTSYDVWYEEHVRNTVTQLLNEQK